LSTFGILASTAWLIASLFERSLDLVHASERRFRSLVQDVTEGIAQIDPTGRFVFANPMTARIFGVAPAELLTRQLADYVIPEHQNLLAHQYELRRAGKRSTCELDITRADGMRRTLDITTTPQTDHTGKFIGSLGAIRDITEQKEPERILRRYEALSENTRDIMLFVRAEDGAICEANYAACMAYGYSRTDLLTKKIFDLRAQDTLSAITTQMQEANQDGILFQAVHVRRDGSTFPVAVSSRGVQIGDERLLLSIIRDITERQQIQDQLIASERLAQATLAALPEEICVLDETGTIIKTNRAWLKFAAANATMPSKDFIGANYLTVCDNAQGPNSTQAAPFAAGIRAVLRGEIEHFALEYPCNSKHEDQWFVGRVTRFPGKGPLRLVVSYENISERKRAEQALRASEAKDRRMFDEAAFGIFHSTPAGRFLDVNPALARMLGYASPRKPVSAQRRLELGR